MFYNGAVCDIYIGKSAGKKLIEDFENAKKSIKIICPYFSPSLIDQLINLKDKGIEIKLITIDKTIHSKSQRKNLYRLIKQHRYINKPAQKKRNLWRNLMRIFLFSLIITFISSIGLFYYLKDYNYLWIFSTSLLLFFIYLFCKKKYTSIKIFKYSYSQLFPFKGYFSPFNHEDSKTFIHSKIYIIDDSIAYLGSINLTESGIKYNYETRIRTTDKEMINKIKEEFDNLFNQAKIPEIDIQKLGRFLYPEPIN